MKQKLIYGLSALISLPGLLFMIVGIYGSYAMGTSIGVVRVSLALLILILIVCEITKIIKKYNDNLSRRASLINISLFVLGVLFLVGIKSHGVFDFTNVAWGAGSILLGYVVAFILNIAAIIRHAKN